MSRIKQSPTAGGFAWLVVSIGVLGSSWLTGNALAAILGTAGLLAFAIHWFLAGRCAANIFSSIRPLANRLRENEPFPFELTLRNRSRFLPLGPFTIVAVESGRGKRSRIRIPNAMSGNATLALVVYPEFSRRGLQKIRLRSFSTRFPFGFTTASRPIAVESDDVRIWPARTPVRTTLFSLLDSQSNASWRERAFRAQDEIDPNRLRDYRLGDSKRRINWRLSAKSDRLIVRDCPERAVSVLFFCLDTHPRFWKRPERFESGIRLLSALVEDAYARRTLGGAIIDGQRFSIRSRSDLEAFMDQLSERSVEPNAPEEPYDPQSGELRIEIGSEARLVDWKGRSLSL